MVNYVDDNYLTTECLGRQKMLARKNLTNRLKYQVADLRKTITNEFRLLTMRNVRQKTQYNQNESINIQFSLLVVFNWTWKLDIACQIDNHVSRWYIDQKNLEMSFFCRKNEIKTFLIWTFSWSNHFPLTGS